MDSTSLVTVFDSKWYVPVAYRAQEGFEPDWGQGSRFRMVFVESGSGIVTLGDYKCAFIAPCLFCLSEKERPQLAGETGLSARSLYFHPAFVNSSFTFENLRDGTGLNFTDQQDRAWLSPFYYRGESYHGYIGLGPASARIVAAAFDGLEKEITIQPDYSVCRSRSYLLEVLFLLTRRDSTHELLREQPLPQGEVEVDKAILYLHTQYHRKITLEELSRAVHLSRTTLSERFARATGQPVMAYLINLRIRLAALMLRETNLPVGEIMERVGFSNSSHFIRTFKKALGQAPTEYRQQNCWMLRTS